MSEFYQSVVKPFLDEKDEIREELFQGESFDEGKHHWRDVIIPFTAKCVDHYGGEGQGDTFYSVAKFTKDDQECFVQFDGWYASHEGSELDDYFEVVPRTFVKEVTEYSKV